MRECFSGGWYPNTYYELINYVHKETPTEVSKGGTILYISRELNYKKHKFLQQVCKPKKLKSKIIEIINKKRKNLIVSGIYKHPTLNNQDFIDSYMLPILEKLSREK